ncbi:MAG: HNH endonuclease [Selenomonadaceae bacterium]|nr:HNH endonuclease [Selenomonadaceae bacterium]
MTKQEKQRELNRRRREEMRPAYDALMKCYPLTLNDLEGEIWRDIFDNYQISNFGRVKSFQRYPNGKILKPALGGGYLCVGLRIDGKTKMFLVHVLVARAFISNPDNKPEINHKDGWRINCHVENLEWVSHAENIQHAFNNGLNKSGMEHSQAKITTEADIICIRENPDNLSTHQLADKFGVSETQIRTIQRGIYYKNVGGTCREKQKQPVNRTPDEIREKICADYATGKYSQSQLARKYGVSQITISRIVHEGIS